MKASHETESRKSFNKNAKSNEESEVNVEGWEFSSEYAIALEYMENHEALVSVF